MCGKHILNIGFNEHHLTGSILARNAANEGYNPSEPLFSSDIEDLPDILLLRTECPVNEMASSVLFDTLELLQSFWVSFMYSDGENNDNVWGAVKCFLSVLFRRAGELIGNTSEGSDTVFTHDETNEVFSTHSVGLSHSGIRRLLDIFIVFFRHIDLYERYQRVQLCGKAKERVHSICNDVLRNHAFEATKDEFWKLSTFYDLPVASRLCYIHRFNGMYNDGSQVAHFHNESYERRTPPRSRKDVTEGIQELAVFRHMYPEIPLFLEDEILKEGQCGWLLLSGRIYYICDNGVPIFDPLVSNMFIARDNI